MNEDDIRKIAGEVAKILKSGETPGGKSKVKVTMGSAGKVFSDSFGKISPVAKKNDLNLGEQNTCGPECQSCNPLNNFTPKQIKDMGVKRVSFCNPDSRSSDIASMIDHTLLKANATQEEIGKLCEDARKYCFASVCVNPAYVSLAARLLRGSGVKTCTVIGFPLGSTTPTVKAIEARDAMANGADEIDMVINIGALKSGNYQLVFDDIKTVREATPGKVLKVIIETSYLSAEEKVKACELAKRAGANFVKTSTGFGSGGATVEDVALMRKVVGEELGVKASGGIRDAATAEAMVKAGATRLGTSASVAIVSGRDAGKGKY